MHGACIINNPLRNVVRGKLRGFNVKPQTEDQLAEILIAKGPLVVAIAADGDNKRYFTDVGNGIFDMDNFISLEPNHSVLIVGFGTENGKDY